MTDPMLQHRRAQTDAHEYTDDPLSSIVTIELNVADACNRTCEFCPHGDPESYPNMYGWMMSLPTIARLAEQTKDWYKGRFSLSGYGEPLLNKAVYDIIGHLRDQLPYNTIEMNTNGDVLTSERIRELFDRGMTYLYINCYDGPWQLSKFTGMLEEAGISAESYRLRSRWKGPDDDYGIVMNNRAGNLNQPDLGHIPLKDELHQPCWYTAYKAFIDWDGNMLFCSNDWGRDIVIGNIHETPLPELWMSDEMRDLRYDLFHGNRAFEPCKSCDVNGTLHSRESMELLARHYGWRYD